MAKGGGRGRPKYRPEFVQQARQLALLGLTDVDMARVFGVGERNLNRWKSTHTDFAAAMNEGKVPADSDVAASLYRKAVGYEYDEEQAIKVKAVIVKDGDRKEAEQVKIVKVRRFQPADTVACIFWLKNRQRHIWRDATQATLRVEHVPGRLTPEQRENTLASEFARLFGGEQRNDGLSA